MKCTKMKLKKCVHPMSIIMTKILNFEQLLKQLLKVFLNLGVVSLILWVRPLWFSALHILVNNKLNYAVDFLHHTDFIVNNKLEK